MKQFTSDYIRTVEPGDWYFDCSMITVCRPVFDKCRTNYDVEALLREAKVIRATNRTDTESCALVVLFKSRKASLAFIARLNTYLTETAKRIQTAYPTPTHAS